MSTGLDHHEHASSGICPVCGSAYRSRSFDAIEPPFRLIRCHDCGHGETHPRLDAAEIARFYGREYYGERNVRFHPLLESLTKLFRERRASVIRSMSRPGRVLDVGCGRGFILAALRDRYGYRSTGVELSDHAAEHARGVLNLDVITESFDAVGLESEHYDVVILWHSLEHMPDPRSTLRKVNRVLRPGGLLVVAVPNAASFQAASTGRHWFHLDIPRHYHHFTLRSIQMLVKATGFETRKVNHFVFEQNPYGWIQSLLNRAGFRHNFLYGALKNSRARSFSVLRHPIETIVTIVVLPFIVPIAALLTLTETLLRNGGTIELYAVKHSGDPE